MILCDMMRMIGTCLEKVFHRLVISHSWCIWVNPLIPPTVKIKVQLGKGRMVYTVSVHDNWMWCQRFLRNVLLYCCQLLSGFLLPAKQPSRHFSIIRSNPTVRSWDSSFLTLREKVEILVFGHFEFFIPNVLRRRTSGWMGLLCESR